MLNVRFKEDWVDTKVIGKCSVANDEMIRAIVYEGVSGVSDKRGGDRFEVTVE